MVTSKGGVLDAHRGPLSWKYFVGNGVEWHFFMSYFDPVGLESFMKDMKELTNTQLPGSITNGSQQKRRTAFAGNNKRPKNIGKLPRSRTKEDFFSFRQLMTISKKL